MLPSIRAEHIYVDPSAYRQRERIDADEDAFNIQLTAEREKQAKMREEQRAHDLAQRQIQADLNAERHVSSIPLLSELCLAMC